MSIPHHIASTRIGQGFLVLCGLLMASCSQDQLPAANEKADEISFQTTTSLTRGLIGSLTSGSEICLYGYKDGNPLANDNENKRLEGKTLRSSGDSWAVYNGDTRLTYFWEGDGNYKFFGWLTKDGTGTTGLQAPTTNFTTTYTNTEDKPYTLEVAGTLDKDYNQFDFLYSNVVNRTVSVNQGKDAVPLNMNHLFSAFGIGISNAYKEDIKIKSITLRHINKVGSATIDYNQKLTGVDDDAPNVNVDYTPGNDNVPIFITRTYTENNTIAKQTGVKYDIFNLAATDKNFYMVWPQYTDNISPELNFETEEEEKDAEAQFPLVLVYEVGGKTVTKRMVFPEEVGDWLPGKKYYFDILIAEKSVQLNVTVTDWQYTTSDVDFREQTVSIKPDGHLVWDETTCRVDHDKREVYVDNEKFQPVEATFCLDTPQGGMWHVSLEGDIDAFTILNDQGMIDGLTHRIKIVPLIQASKQDYKVKLKFIATSADGKNTFNADDVIQDIPGQDEGYDHEADIYTIVLRKV